MTAQNRMKLSQPFSQFIALSVAREELVLLVIVWWLAIIAAAVSKIQLQPLFGLRLFTK